MANKTISAQYRLRGDTLENLNAKNAVYANREPVIVVLPADSNSGLNEPAVLLKIGDGVTSFKELPYVSAIAGDVPAWAKAATKPEYTAAEIKNLESYIAGKIQNTNTQYKLEQDDADAHILKLFKKDLNDSDWSVIATITTADTVYDDTALSGRVTSLETLVGDTNVSDFKQQVDDLIGEIPADSAATSVVDYINEKVDTLNGTGEGSIKKTVDDAINEFATKVSDDNVVNSFKELVDWVAQHGSEAAEMTAAIDALEAKLLGIDNTVAEYVTAAIAALKIGDYAKAADLAALADQMTVVTASEVNGNIKINDTEVNVYTLPDTVLDSADTLILDGGNA